MADRLLLADSAGSTRVSRARSDRCCWCCRSRVLLVFGVLVAQFRRFSAGDRHPVGRAAVAGRGVRAPVADRDPAERVFVHGPDPPDRADREERHHPGGLRGYRRRRAATTGREALVEAGAVRLRPILMTTLCTLFGLAAARARTGPRGGAAEAPGDRGHWRADTVDHHHAAIRAGGARARAAPRRWRRSGCVSVSASH